MTEAERLADAIDPIIRKRLDNLTCSAAAAELRRLASIEAERNALKRDLDAELAGNAELRTQLRARDNETMRQFASRLSAEVEALRVDAGRYRWLRDSVPNYKTLACGEIEIGKYAGMHWSRKVYRGSEMDAAIDAAMKEQP